MSLCPRPPADRMYRVTNPQGICLVINIRRYDPPSTLAERIGSEKDVGRVRRLFEQTLHFDVRIKEDLTGAEIADCVKSAAQEDLTSHGCFVCFLMGHGSNDKLIGRDGESQSLSSLVSMLYADKCPALAHKPKIFFVHASRPDRTTTSGGGPSTGEPEEGVEGTVDSDSLSFTNFFLRDMDFLVCFANTEGSPVLDDAQMGSAFVRAVCRLLGREHKEDHLDDIMTDVNRYMKTHPVQQNGRQHYYVPERVSSLTRKCFLDPDMATD